MTVRQFFGTDGVRGRANVAPMTADFTLQLGKAIGVFLRSHRGRRPRVLIGKDTRLSGYLFETALSSGLVSTGADVLLVGPLPTPGIAFLTSGMRCDAGVVISASHNPFGDNGIKLFDHGGFKFPDRIEAELESMIGAGTLASHHVTGTDIGKAFRVDDALGRYAVFAKSAFPRSRTLEGLKIVVDCANGAAYRVAPEVFQELGAEVVSVNVSPDGENINQESGALSPQLLAERVLSVQADVGIALDGDADRCILCDRFGQTVDGDQTLAILAAHMSGAGLLESQTVVATVMSNLGLERSLTKMGLNLIRTQVGDRYVVESMREGNHQLGGEQSGHIVQLNHATTGDGLMAALAVLGCMVEKNAPLDELARVMTKYPQALKNVEVREKPPLADLPGMQSAVSRIEKQLGEDGRVLVRYSGTENKLRVMVEGPTQDVVVGACDVICSAVREEIGHG